MAGLTRVQRPNVLFGYDGTEENEPALCWAVEEARLRGLDLVMCHCWHWPYPPGHEDENARAILERAGQNLLSEGAARARELGAPGRVRTVLGREPVSDTLVRESGDAELIVIGSHEQRRLPAGSTAVELPARARRPVVVVRRPAGGGPVVVGVDGSPAADAALRFAVEEAVLRERDLHVVWGAWEPGAVPEAELPLFYDKEELLRARTAMVEESLRVWRELYPKVNVRVSVLLERPRQALLGAAADAALLVVGDRGVGGVDELLLGATSSAMLHHAPCTVAVVPAG